MEVTKKRLTKKRKKERKREFLAIQFQYIFLFNFKSTLKKSFFKKATCMCFKRNSIQFKWILNVNLTQSFKFSFNSGRIQKIKIQLLD